MRIEGFLKESPLFAVTSAARRLEGLTTQVLEGDNLSFLEALVLTAIFFEAPHSVRPSNLAETFGTTRSHVSHCVSSLEAKGLLRRNIDTDDGRAYWLTLKPQGKRTAVRVIGAFDRLQRAFERDAGHPALRAMFKTLLQVEDAFRSMISKPRIE
jgi:DNA-binding MarR family transcriptional regulator